VETVARVSRSTVTERGRQLYLLPIAQDLPSRKSVSEPEDEEQKELVLRREVVETGFPVGSVLVLGGVTRPAFRGSDSCAVKLGCSSVNGAENVVIWGELDILLEMISSQTFVI